ncbi:hypothetical protein BD769DRAFT_1782000 [Suillus cothurnatus]|nr:hypothetical protein BD769DRAFT_1782000 [Suillus cothurnatus]
MFHNILLYITFSSVHRFTDVKAPYVGLDLAAYESSHAKTLGHESDALMANETLHWDRPFKTVRAGGFETGDIIWFPEGGLNAPYNCVDRWAFKHPNNDGCLVTYAELLHEVCSIANILKALGVKKGDTVSVYLPMTWQFVLACARIGAVHSVVFTDFSAESLHDRVQDCKSHVVLTSEEGRRGGKSIATKAIVDTALEEYDVIGAHLLLRVARSARCAFY